MTLSTLSACRQAPNQDIQIANPILQDWDTPFGSPPYDKIKSEHYAPAIREGMRQQLLEIKAIVENREAPNFENTIVAIERSGATLKKATAIFDAIQTANTNEVLKQTAEKIRPELADHYGKIHRNIKLFRRVEKVYDQKNALELSEEDRMLLEKQYKKFLRSGVGLPDDKKQTLQQINQKLASLAQQFENNLLEETNAFELHVVDEKDLGDLPRSFKSAAAEEALKRGHKSGWSFTLQRASIYPFLDYSPNRSLRKKILMAYSLRANNDNSYDNKDVIEQMVRLRTQKAQLLGYDSHADYVLEERMAGSVDKVYALLDKIWKPALDMAQRDRDQLAKRMSADGIAAKFEASDWRYYVRKIREEKYRFDEDKTRPYFEVNSVLKGAFDLAKQLFGLRFVERKDVATWHPDQKVYEVKDQTDKHIGLIYFDFYARPSKRGGAWMNELRPQSKLLASTPIVTNNFNFPAPSAASPSLLSFTQAQTLFHEFGHGLHGLLSDVTYASLSGTNVPRDFVEFPSQVIENWMAEPKVLALYAKHYETGELIPDDMVQKMKQANAFDEGFRTVEYMAAAYLDMAWHSLTDTTKRSTNAFEKKLFKRIGLIEEILPRYRSTYFAHMAGGYSAGYYSYIWSEILDADAFDAFVQTGDVLHKGLAAKYRAMLSAGGSKSGMELYKSFRGREPNIQSLLNRKGF